jgi:hypothetical protein
LWAADCGQHDTVPIDASSASRDIGSRDPCVPLQAVWENPVTRQQSTKQRKEHARKKTVLVPTGGLGFRLRLVSVVPVLVADTTVS